MIAFLRRVREADRQDCLLYLDGLRGLVDLGPGGLELLQVGAVNRACQLKMAVLAKTAEKGGPWLVAVVNGVFAVVGSLKLHNLGRELGAVLRVRGLELGGPLFGDQGRLGDGGAHLLLQVLQIDLALGAVAMLPGKTLEVVGGSADGTRPFSGICRNLTDATPQLVLPSRLDVRDCLGVVDLLGLFGLGPVDGLGLVHYFFGDLRHIEGLPEGYGAVRGLQLLRIGL